MSWEDKTLADLQDTLVKDFQSNKCKLIRPRNIDAGTRLSELYSFTLNFNEEELKHDDKMAELHKKYKDKKCWGGPLISLTNLVRHERDPEMWYKLYPGAATKDPVPVVCLRLALHATFQERMELMQFPFDDQDLTIELQAGYEREHHLYPILLVKNQNPVYQSLISKDTPFTQASEYELHDRIQVLQKVTKAAESNDGHEYSRLGIKMRVTRYSFFWMVNVVLPMFILSTSLFSTFVLPTNETNDRLAATLTLLLAMVAFKFVIAEKLPNVSYLTYVDKYVIACFVLGFAVVWLHVLARAEFYSEPFVTWTIRGTAAPSDGGGGNPSAVDDDGGDVDDDTRLAFDLPTVRRVRFNLILIAGTCTWIFLHVIAGVLLLYAKSGWFWHDPFWHDPQNAIWIGPVRSELLEDRERAKVAASRLMENFERFLKAPPPEDRRRKSAWRIDALGASFAFNGRETPDDRDAALEPLKARVSHVMLWDADNATKHIDETRKHWDSKMWQAMRKAWWRWPGFLRGSFVLSEHCLLEKYRCKSAFAVVVFQGIDAEEAAKVAVRHNTNKFGHIKGLGSWFKELVVSRRTDRWSARSDDEAPAAAPAAGPASESCPGELGLFNEPIFERDAQLEKLEMSFYPLCTKAQGAKDNCAAFADVTPATSYRRRLTSVLRPLSRALSSRENSEVNRQESTTTSTYA